MSVPIIMPRQGQSVETCIITRWLVQKGDQVKAGDLLFSYETDKASFEAESPAAGTLLDIFFTDGEEVPVLTPVGVIGMPGEDLSDYGSRQSNPAGIQAIAEAAPVAPQRTDPSLPDDTGKIRISPRARMIAVKLGIELSAVTGTGPNGRIIARDVEAFKQPATESKSLVDLTIGQEFTDKPLTNVRKLIARTMHESISQSAQLTHHMSADARKILAFRKIAKSAAEKDPAADITLNDMVCFATLRALRKFPELNSHFLGNIIRNFNGVHLGLAVDTPRGLMVPVVKNAGDYTLTGLASRLREAAALCRKGNINPELLASTAASFTISNLGNYGVEWFTPIINLPQVAILGVNTIIYRPADLGDGTIGFIPVIGLSLTYDHRAVDGGPATLFLREIRKEIEEFRSDL